MYKGIFGIEIQGPETLVLYARIDDQNQIHAYTMTAEDAQSLGHALIERAQQMRVVPPPMVN